MRRSALTPRRGLVCSFLGLFQASHHFMLDSERLSPRTFSSALRGALLSHARKFLGHFHTRQLEALTGVLGGEHWIRVRNISGRGHGFLFLVMDSVGASLIHLCEIHNHGVVELCRVIGLTKHVLYLNVTERILPWSVFQVDVPAECQALATSLGVPAGTVVSPTEAQLPALTSQLTFGVHRIHTVGAVLMYVPNVVTRTGRGLPTHVYCHAG